MQTRGYHDWIKLIQRRVKKIKTAKDILQEAFVIDAHLDLFLDLEQKHARGRFNVILQDYIESFKEGFVDVVFAAIFVEEDYLPEQGLRRALDQIAALYQEIDASNGEFVVVKNTDDILKARAKGQVGILIAFEGVEPLSGDIKLLRSFYELGVRVVGLCWSRSNWAADGCSFFSEKPGYGVTDAGVELIAYAEKLGMLIDVSHCNIKSFWDVVNLTNRPFIATHSNSYTVSPCPRNLKDDQIAAMRNRGCVMGLNGASLIVNYANPASASLDDLGNHLLYEQKVGSSSMLCIGFDQCSRYSAGSQAMAGELATVFDVIPTHGSMPEFVEMLIRRGFSEQEIFGILGGNVMRLLEETIG